MRCVDCGCPERDHTPLRYPFRAWWRHVVLRLFNPFLNLIQDTLGDI